MRPNRIQRRARRRERIARMSSVDSETGASSKLLPLLSLHGTVLGREAYTTRGAWERIDNQERPQRAILRPKARPHLGA
jgi:hypothetical protein